MAVLVAPLEVGYNEEARVVRTPWLGQNVPKDVVHVPPPMIARSESLSLASLGLLRAKFHRWSCPRISSMHPRNTV